MRLDELKFNRNGLADYELTLKLWVWDNGDGTFDIGRSDDYVQAWLDLDPLTAQAVLFELTKPCRVADPS